MISRRCVVSAFLVFFSRIRFASSRRTRTLLHQSEKHFDEKERILVIWWWCFYNKRRDFETTRFSFSFLLRTQGGKKKIHSRQKESFHLLQKRARALKEHRHTHAHTKPREREKKTTLFSSSLIELFVYFVFVLFARTTEREKERRHFIISPLCKKRL